MLKCIAYIGYGFVGRACHKQFEHNAESIIIDPKYTDNKVIDLHLTNPELVFVSINCPTLEDGTVDANDVYTVFLELSQIEYAGIVVLKSTLPPKIVQDLSMAFPSLNYVYSPEFLRQEFWEFDCISPDQIILAGNETDCRILEKLYIQHSNVLLADTRFTIMNSYSQASLIKYTINAYLASKVVFVNQIHDLFHDMNSPVGPDDASWHNFADILSQDSRIGYSHMQVPGNDKQYGYGGACFPKDIKAMLKFDKNQRLTMLQETEIVNTKIRLKGGHE